LALQAHLGQHFFGIFAMWSFAEPRASQTALRAHRQHMEGQFPPVWPSNACSMVAHLLRETLIEHGGEDSCFLQARVVRGAESMQRHMEGAAIHAEVMQRQMLDHAEVMQRQMLDQAQVMQRQAAAVQRQMELQVANTHAQIVAQQIQTQSDSVGALQ